MSSKSIFYTQRRPFVSDNMIRDDFEYSLGNWTLEEQPDGITWSHVSTPTGDVYYDHTGGAASQGKINSVK